MTILKSILRKQDGDDWINLAQDRDRQAFVHKVMNLGNNKKQRNFSAS
jgi:hypothetical protein